MIRTFRLGVFALALCALCAPARSDSFLLELDGRWTGSGWAKQTAHSEKQAVRCRISGRYRQRAEQLSISGRCAGGGRSIAIQGRVSRTGTAIYSGTWSGLSGGEPRTVRGHRRGNAIRFSWTEVDRKTGKFVRNRTTWRVMNGQFILTLHQKGAENRKLADVVFSRPP